jgi:hypothetical protein
MSVTVDFTSVSDVQWYYQNFPRTYNRYAVYFSEALQNDPAAMSQYLAWIQNTDTESPVYEEFGYIEC